MGNAGGEGHGGFSLVGRNWPVEYCVASSTSSAGRVGNFCLDVILLQVAVGLCFCQNRELVLSGWWVSWLAGHCQTCHGQK